MNHRNFLTAVLLAALAAGAAADPPPALTLAEQQKLVWPVDVAAAADGSRIYFAARTVDREADRFVPHLFVLEPDGGWRQLTRSAEGESSPRVSPDGTHIAFLSPRPKTGTGPAEVGLWILPAGGGEAWRLATHATGVLDCCWSPDGSFLVFTAEKAEETGSAGAPRVFGVVDAAPAVEFWRVAFPEGGARRIAVAPPGVDGFEIAPDGTRLVLAANGTGKMNEDQQFDLYLLELATGALRKLTEFPGPEIQPRWSPDGRWIAYLSQTVPDIESAETDVSRVPAGGGPPENLTAAWPRAVERFEWLTAGEILFSEAAGVHTRPCRLAVASRAVTVLDEGPWSYSRLGPSRTGGAWWLRAGRTELPEIVTWTPAEGFQDRSRFSRQLAGYRLAERRILRWQRPDGMTVEGLLVLPAGYAPPARVPLVVTAHGGPFDRFQDTLLQYDPWEDLAAAGFAVLAPNVRGSSGYSDAFGQANLGDIGGGDLEDLLAGVDHVVSLGIADPERLGIVGGSYGGYMVNRAITRTPRFRAAVSMFGIWSLFTDFGNSEQPCWERMFTGTYFWEPGGIEAWLRHSPMAEAAAVRTPVLVLHGEEDTLTDRANSREMWQTLRLMGRTVEYVRYPGEGHGLSRHPGNRLDVSRRILAWFERYLKD